MYFVESTIPSPLKGSVCLKSGLLNDARDFFGFDIGKLFRNELMSSVNIYN